MNRNEISDRIGELTGWVATDKFTIHTDTSDWMRILRGDVLFLEGHYFGPARSGALFQVQFVYFKQV